MLAHFIVFCNGYPPPPRSSGGVSGAVWSAWCLRSWPCHPGWLGASPMRRAGVGRAHGRSTRARRPPAPLCFRHLSSGGSLRPLARPACSPGGPPADPAVCAAIALLPPWDGRVAVQRRMMATAVLTAVQKTTPHAQAATRSWLTRETRWRRVGLAETSQGRLAADGAPPCARGQTRRMAVTAVGEAYGNPSISGRHPLWDAS